MGGRKVLMGNSGVLAVIGRVLMGNFGVLMGFPTFVNGNPGYATNYLSTGKAVIRSLVDP
jgi:hypothetical protein